MRVLYIHNKYARPSGEEHASQSIVDLLEEHGHEVRWYTRSSEEIASSKAGMIKSFFTGIYNPSSRKDLAKILDEFKPDVVQVQNLYPLISASILPLLKSRGIPVVMRCPNYRLFCPQGLSLDNDGMVCEKCWTGAHEYWCVKKNCTKNRVKSLGYAARNMFARLTGMIRDNIDVFIVQSDFQKQKFISKGIPEEKIAIVPGLSPNINDKSDIDQHGDYVCFVGRVSPEKGIDEFIEAARINPNINFKVAGAIDDNYHLPDNLPDNIEFVGFLKGDALIDFYKKSRIVVVPSKWYEGFPNVIVAAMLLKRPVITTNIGAMQSIIDPGINGILVTPADGKELGKAISSLYTDINQCRKYGEAGYNKANTEYSRDSIYQCIIDAYDKAKQLTKSK